MKKVNKKTAHPYIPNSHKDVQDEMLREIGEESLDALIDKIIPVELQYKGSLNFPEPLLSEYELKRHIKTIISKNKSCEEYLCFLGGGTWPHYVPAICDEIASRGEFLTAYAGEPYEDHGRWQALFEYESLMAELLDMDVVSVPIYSWGHAAGTSLRMAARVTGRSEILISDTISPERRGVLENYLEPQLDIRWIAHDHATGLVDLEDLRAKISDNTAAVYFENPTYFGFIEEQGKEISDIAHREGALVVVGVDPVSLGVLEPPGHYGADIVCGELQPLGNHMNFGGSLAGFVATYDTPKIVREIPYRIFGIAPTSVPGEYGFGDVAFDRTSFMVRENPGESKEFVGTATALWGIVAGVYLSLMGPEGMRELGETIIRKTHYAMDRISDIPGIEAPAFDAHHFKEFVVDFNGAGMRVSEVNEKLLEHGIIGGIDLSSSFSELGESALYCVTEIHTKKDIDRLYDALSRVVGGY